MRNRGKKQTVKPLGDHVATIYCFQKRQKINKILKLLHLQICIRCSALHCSKEKGAYFYPAVPKIN